MVVAAVRDFAGRFRAFCAAWSDCGRAPFRLPPGGARGERRNSGGCARPAGTRRRHPCRHRDPPRHGLPIEHATAA